MATHPWRSLIAGLAVMVLLMIPMFSMRLGLEVGLAGKDTTRRGPPSSSSAGSVPA